MNPKHYDIKKVLEELEHSLYTTKEDLKMARPRTKALPKALPMVLSNITIEPVANGYMLTSTDTGKMPFVFTELDDAFEFIKDRLQKTFEEEQFIKDI